MLRDSPTWFREGARPSLNTWRINSRNQLSCNLHVVSACACSFQDLMNSMQHMSGCCVVAHNTHTTAGLAVPFVSREEPILQNRVPRELELCCALLWGTMCAHVNTKEIGICLYFEDHSSICCHLWFVEVLRSHLYFSKQSPVRETFLYHIE